jgi:hypothetical protein
MPVLLALATLLVAAVVGVVLMVNDNTLVGIVVLFASIPLALVVWIVVNDRRR